ncbi:amidohydrolase family protein [Mycobacterium aquaticum]|uniref:2-hydroxy-3-carboxy-6-oxo-7-methylocta-2, 4-dienoate decarboxylase n=1 Tax=Mycobacterium aquaticum TaxID=1927124 RepID=A0A1X0AUJ1_9MYCO|nr:amidohydrolase family protein [Mycobacterium aquaticum]ORA33316.1 2-hydroxy-3-carboxy-6-oxo-7-methylocta-2,4-dienoate decarboxylase [Mycobacterium aquaticum]
MNSLIDVHAHWLPRELFGLPEGAPYAAMHDRGGELYLGEVPLSIATDAMSDVAAILDDMRVKGIGMRALSAPPFAFPLTAGERNENYAATFNSALAEQVSRSDGRLVGLGMVTLGTEAAATRQLEELAATEGIRGVAIPPLLDGRSLDTGVLRHVLTEADRLDLAVLVHPMQLPRPEWPDYYLANLIGNPVETATAVASLLLGGVMEALPGLRICFVHGGGCAPWLVSRWAHAWKARPDVRRASAVAPDTALRTLYFDTVVYDGPQLELLRRVAGKDQIACGSDYPFDMAEPDPARFALDGGLEAAELVAAAVGFLGIKGE